MKHVNKKIVVLGIYGSFTAAERGVDLFRDRGFRSQDISALLPSGDRTREFAHTKGTKAPEGATTGGTTGAVVGATLGWLAGIGTLAIPGVGPFIAAGPIMAALSGAAVVGSLGAIGGAIVGMGIPEYEAKRYEGHVKEGGILVSVHCDTNEWKNKAKQVFSDTGATDISSTSEESISSDEENLSHAATY